MGRKDTPQTDYGPGKYAAFHLLLGTWVRQFLGTDDCVYVTLGGTELRDVRSLAFLNHRLAESVYSFEKTPDRYQLACASRDRLASEGITVNCIEGSIFEYERVSQQRHLFFVDLEGICTPEFSSDFERFFKEGTLREGDGLLVTSHLGHNPGYVKKIFRWFRREYEWLDVTDAEEKRKLYRSCHASFVVYRGLEDSNLIDDVKLTCFGSVLYHDTSPMGVYGFALSEGATRFGEFVRATPTFVIPTARRQRQLEAST